MNFDTLIAPLPTAPLPPEGGFSAPCMEDAGYDLEQSPYGTAEIEFDRNGRPVGTRLDVAFDNLDRKLIEFYGESFRHKLNLERTKRGQKPL